MIKASHMSANQGLTQNLVEARLENTWDKTVTKQTLWISPPQIGT